MFSLFEYRKHRYTEAGFEQLGRVHELQHCPGIFYAHRYGYNLNVVLYALIGILVL